MKKLISLFILMSLLACKKNSIELKEGSNTVKKNNSQKTTLSIISSEEFIENWSEIISFETELKKVLNTNLNSEKDLEQLIKLLEDLKKTYPEKFKTPTIEARVKVLETSILMLSQNLKEGTLNKVEVNLIEIQSAYNNFVNKIKAQILKEQDYEKYR